MTRVLWDVDTQSDFMLPEGKLYVPGAEETAPTMARLVAAAREAGLVHVASADDHELTDPEISDAPDFRNTYPPHCLRGTRGAARIAETEQADPLPLSLVPYPPGLVPEEIVVFGVATDVCNDAAIRGFLQRGRRVVFVEDAARGLDAARTQACTTSWREGGVEFSTVDEVVASLG